MCNVPFFKIHPDAIIPKQLAYNFDTGLDLCAMEDTKILYGVNKIRTGLGCVFPSGYYGEIRDKSSQASKGLMVAGGIIDNGYRGEIIILINYPYVQDSMIIQRGQKVAQLILYKRNDIIPIEISPEDCLNSNTERGDKGFGSSGKFLQGELF